MRNGPGRLDRARVVSDIAEKNPSALKRSSGARGTVARRTVVASLRGAEVATAAAAVASRDDVEQRRKVRIRVRSIVDRARVAGEGIHAANDRGRNTGPAEDEPTAVMQAVGVVDRDPGIRIGHRRDVRNGPTRAPRVELPTRLGDVRAAPTPGAAPHRLGPGTAAA